jgi:hypothetical protein
MDRFVAAALLSSLPRAAWAGEIREATLEQLVRELVMRDRVCITIEAPLILESCEVCIPDAPWNADPGDIAEALGGGSCDLSSLSFQVEDTCVHIREIPRAGGPVPLMDRVVAVPAGRYEVDALADELGAALRATFTTADPPLVGVSCGVSWGSCNSVWEVPSSAPVTARELLTRAVFVDAPGSPREPRLVWAMRDGPYGQSVGIVPLPRRELDAGPPRCKGTRVARAGSDDLCLGGPVACVAPGESVRE